MKICIIANGYPSKREPQWGCFERDQALALKGLGHEVSIMYIDRRFRKYWRKIGITKKKELGLSIYGMFYIPLGWLRDKVSYRLHQQLIMSLYVKLFKEYVKDHGNPDVIYAHYVWNIAYVSKIKDKYHIPLVGIEHWSGLTKESLPPLGRYWGEIAYSHTDKLLAVSKSLQSHIKRHFGKDSIVVYDMLGQEFISPKVLKIEKNDFYKGGNFFFLSIGTLIQRKGFDVLISAFAKSNLASKGCKVIIVGDGPEKNKLLKQANESGITEFVSLAGKKTKEEIIGIISESHAFVLSSRAETFGVVCIEALSQGLPNISTACGGPEEFITDKNGLLIPTNDIDAMAKAMCQMYENYTKYDRSIIANDCISRFSPKVIASQLTEIFKEVTI